jgi:hypothetical protein
MPPEIQTEGNQANVFTPLTKVTPLSKYLALALFVILPVVALYVGTQLAPVEYVEVEKVVYRDTPVAAQATDVPDMANSEALIAPHPAGNISLRAEEYMNANGLPESRIYVGDILLLNAHGHCNFAPFDKADLFASRPMLQTFMPNINTIIESGTCWWGGGGSELYSVVMGEVQRIVGLEVFECGNLPVSQCSGFGEPQVLYEIDAAGVVTKQYTGGIFGG